MYQQYLQARDSAARSSDAGMRESAEADSAAREPDSRLEQIIREGESYIQTFGRRMTRLQQRNFREVVPDGTHCKENIRVCERKPGTGRSAETVYELLYADDGKLVNAYREMDEQLVQGENMKAAKREIAQTLDTINEAYEKL